MFLQKMFKTANKNIHLNKDAAKLLHNKYVLYVVASIAFINLMFLLIGGDIFHALIFFIIGFLTSFFSKNMVVILAITLAITNVIRFGLSFAKEGMENVDEGMDEEGMDEEGMDEEGMENVDEGMDDEEERRREGMENVDEGMDEEGMDEEGMDEEGMENVDEGMDEEGMDEEGMDEEEERRREGMSNLGYSSIVPSLLNDQYTLFTNVSKLTPYVIKAENASIKEKKLKYESFVSR